MTRDEAGRCASAIYAAAFIGAAADAARTYWPFLSVPVILASFMIVSLLVWWVTR